MKELYFFNAHRLNYTLFACILVVAVLIAPAKVLGQLTMTTPLVNPGAVSGNTATGNITSGITQITVMVYGGGGGGGGSTSSSGSNNNGAGAGGGGAFAMQTFTITSGQGYTISCTQNGVASSSSTGSGYLNSAGNGGAAGANNGQYGGTITFSLTGGGSVTANGGNPGTGAAATTAAAGGGSGGTSAGAGSGYAAYFAGGNGSAGSYSAGTCGGGGGGAGNAGSGANGSTGTGGAGGIGGGGAGGGNQNGLTDGTTGLAGNAGNTPGGGGGAAFSAKAVAFAGGAGGAGMVVIFEGQIYMASPSVSIITATANWTEPSCVAAATAFIWGGGGAGGGSSYTGGGGDESNGGGGGGGACTINTITVSSGQTWKATIGAGGTASTGTGGAGGVTMFASTSGTAYSFTAAGGGGGTGESAKTTGGAGGNGDGNGSSTGTVEAGVTGSTANGTTGVTGTGGGAGGVSGSATALTAGCPLTANGLPGALGGYGGYSSNCVSQEPPGPVNGFAGGTPGGGGSGNQSAFEPTSSTTGGAGGGGEVIIVCYPNTPPVISSFNPTSGAWGSSVTINGTGFTNSTGNTVTFNGVATATPTSQTTTSMVVTVPTGVPCSGDSVIVTNATGCTSTPVAFPTMATAPTFTSFSPAGACVGSGQVVTINGSNFIKGGTTVTFYNGQAATVTYVSATQVTAVLPAGANTGTISVATCGGTVTSAGFGTPNFVVTSIPVITPASPTLCASGATTAITVTNPGSGSFGSLSGTATGTTIPGSGGSYTLTTASTSGTASFTYNNLGCTATLNATVNPAPTSPASITGTLSLCVGGSTPLAVADPTISGTNAPTPTISTTYNIYKYLASGTFTPSTALGDVDVTIIGGGGGGGYNEGGGGGGGGYTYSTGNSIPASAQTVTVGTVGAASTSTSTQGGTGGQSVFASFTAGGGGGGGGSSSDNGLTGASSGGGGCTTSASGTSPAVTVNGSGCVGGAGLRNSTASKSAGGGGGGAGGTTITGAAGTTSTGGKGSNGAVDPITSATFGGGGGGGATTGGAAGTGSTGTGGSAGSGTAGSANTGGGGGGGGASSVGGAGGSGIVIVRVPNVGAWSSNNANIPVSSSGVVTCPSTPGSATITYMYTGSNGCTSSVTASVVATATPSITSVTATQPACGTPTGSIAIVATGTDQYSIDGTTFTNTTGSFPSIAPSTNATVKVRSIANNSCVATYASNPVAINAVPSLPTINSVTPTQPRCSVTTGSISISATGTDQYSINNGSTFTNTTGSFSTLSSGNYNVEVRLTSDNTCISIWGNNPVVINSPNPVSVSAANTGAYGVGETIQLTSSVSGGAPTYSYLWNGPALINDTAADPSIANGTVAISGTYTVQVTDANGCSATGSTLVVVNPTTIYTWTGAIDTNWSTTTNWIPTAGTGGPNACSNDVIIPLIGNQPVINADVQVGNLTINSGVRLTLNANMHVCKSWLGGSGSIATVSGTGVVLLDGSGPETLAGNSNIYELKLNNSSGASLVSGANVEIANALDLETGTLSTTGATLTLLSTDTNQSAIIDNFSNGNSGTLSGTIIAQRYYASSNYANQHEMGSPVDSPSLAQFGASGTPGNIIPNYDCDEQKVAGTSPWGTVFSYNESNPLAITCGMGVWTVMSPNADANNGLGYSVVKAGTGTLSLTGTANLNSSYTISGLTNSNWINMTEETHTLRSGWALLSNPYLATLNLTAANEGMDAQVQVWKSEGLFAGSYQPSNTVAPFQAFLVHNSNPGTTPSYTIYANERERTAQTFYDLSAQQLSIVVTDLSSGLLDKTVVGFNPVATDSFDPQLDANKFAGSLNRQTLYSLNNGLWMAINILNSINTAGTVSIGFEPGNSDNFNFTFNGINTFDPTSYIYIEDIQTGVAQDVRRGDYSFSSNVADNWNRFVLHFTPPAQITTISQSCTAPGMINVTQPGSANWSYVLTGSNNAVITTGVLNRNSSLNIAVNAGAYALTLRDTNNYTVVKTIQVNGELPVTAGFNLLSDTVAVNSPVTFTNTSQNATLISWAMGDGTVINGVTSPTYSFTNPGNYLVTLTVKDADGCMATVTRSIVVTGALSTGINGVTGSGEVIDIWSAKNKVYVDFTAFRNVNSSVIIYDILGQEISREKWGSNAVYIKEINGISAAYLIVVAINADQITTRKVFIANGN